LKASETAAKDMTPAEAATATGKANSKQPWVVYQVYASAITIATITITLTAIY
jgi:hypothetical protein